MIISLRGTNGAGKSTIVHEVLKWFAVKRTLWWEGRRKPVGYMLANTQIGQAHTFIPGHYEIANGGVDTLPNLDTAYELIRTYAQRYHVLYEGKNMSDGPKRLMDIASPRECMVIVVDHPVWECIRSVRERGHTIKEETIYKVDKKVRKDIVKFREEGYEVLQLNRNDALSKCLELLK